MNAQMPAPETPEDALGLRLLRWGIDGASELEKNLRQTGDVVVAKDEDAFTLELLVFTLFPVDALVQREFGTDAPRIRRSLRERLDRMARERPELPSPEGEPGNSFDELVSRRFEEYNKAFGFDRLGDPGHRKESTRQLSRLGAKRITGTENVDPLVSQLLQINFLGTLQSLPDALASVREELFEATSRTSGNHDLVEAACPACGKRLVPPGKSWSLDWWWAEHLSDLGRCWNCTPLSRRVILAIALASVIGAGLSLLVS